ncbi:MAG: tRNA dihydrouridine synthase [Lachnospiraceae bacterium]
MSSTTRFYLAPMEEITGYVFRNVYEKLFGDVDKYFTPFLSPTQKKVLKTRAQKDVAPEHNEGMYVVPQILTNKVEDFLHTLYYLLELGYEEINLNLGCPSGTVVSKKKGAGMLDDPDELDAFFAILFDQIWREGLERRVKISVKSRIGLQETYEFEDLIKVYNRYPISELILHPRLQKEFYKGEVHREIYAWCLENSIHPVCYNGDVFTRQDYETLLKDFPSTGSVMLGRGVIGNPGLIREIKTGQVVSLEELKIYADTLYLAYCEELGNNRDALFKMKEVWSYLYPVVWQKKMVTYPVQNGKCEVDGETAQTLDGETAHILERCYRDICKAKDDRTYQSAVHRIFQ